MGVSIVPGAHAEYLPKRLTPYPVASRRMFFCIIGALATDRLPFYVILSVIRVDIVDEVRLLLCVCGGLATGCFTWSATFKQCCLLLAEVLLFALVAPCCKS